MADARMYEIAKYHVLRVFAVLRLFASFGYSRSKRGPKTDHFGVILGVKKVISGSPLRNAILGSGQNLGVCANLRSDLEVRLLELRFLVPSEMRRFGVISENDLF